MNSRIYLPAEWEAQQAVLLAWPHALTDWNYMLREVTECYRAMAEAIVRFVPLIIVTPDPDSVKALIAHLPQERISYFKVDTNDTWTRDYGPITTADRQSGRLFANDFKFNAWGLKFAANLDNLVSRKLHDAGLLPGEYVNRLGFVLEGGSIESDGRGTILTTSECLLSPNRNGDLSREQITERLCQYLGAEKVLWLDHGALQGDDTDSHIDTLARLAPHDTILYVSTTPDDPQYAELEAMREQLSQMTTLEGKPFNLIGLPLPEPIYDPDDADQRLPATYANYLVTNGAVIMPTYGQPKPDLLASQLLRIAYPDHEIVPVDCRALIRQHGSLHCATMQIPKSPFPNFC